MQKGFTPILLLIVGIVVILLVGGAFYMGMQTSPTNLKTEVTQVQKENTSPTNSQPSQSSTHIADDTFLPVPFFDKVQWQSNGNSVNSPYDVLNVDGKPMKVKGFLWTYTKTNISTMQEFNEDSIGRELFAYYDNALTKRDWTYETTINGHTLSALRADGGGSSVNGYLKSNNGNVQVYDLISSSTFAKGEFPVDAQCPCTQTYQIFVSNIVPVADLLK